MLNLCYLLTIEIILLVTLYKFTSNDFTSPGVVTLVTFIASTIAVIHCRDVWNVDIYYTFRAFYLTAMGLTAITITELLVIWMFQSKYENKIIKFDENNFNYIYVSKHVKIFVVMISIAMMLYFVFDVYRNGMNIVNKDDISFIGALKHDEDIGVDVLSKICMRLNRSLSYSCAFIFAYNIISVPKKIRKEIWLLIPLATHCIQIFFYGGRLAIVAILIALFIYVVFMSRFKYGWKKINFAKYSKPLIIGTALFILFFGLSRNIVKNKIHETSELYYFSYYLGNSLFLFSRMIPNPYNAYPKVAYWGAYTFRDLCNELQKYRLIDVTHNIEVNFLYLNLGNKRLNGGNVYTLFGPLYRDFGVFGILIVTVVLYFFVTYVYYKYFKYSGNFKKSLNVLLVFGMYYYMIFIAFYEAPTALFKIQSVFEVILSYIIIQLIKKVKVKI